MNLRAAAAKIIFEVLYKGQSLSDAFGGVKTTDKAFLQALTFGVCRSYFRLEKIAELLLEKPLKEKDGDIFCLILVGLYQLQEMRVPDFAAISETVAATTQLKKPWAKGLVNAVLRNYQRQSENILQKINSSPEVKWLHPDWFIDVIKKDWPNDYETILKENNEHPPFSLRVNFQKIAREKYLTTVKGAVISETPSGVVLDTPMDVKELPGFLDGEVSIQDGASQLVTQLITCKKDDYVLDACAAPGGKTAALLESYSDITLLALDRDIKRLEKISENLQRLGLSATVKHAKAEEVAQWWDGKLFDHILLDAPCSGTGVIRRHPDIKLLRTPEDITRVQLEQKELLEALWPLLKQGGTFVYATCSVLKSENVENILDFLRQHPDAIEDKINAAWGMGCEVGRQILPGMQGMDGFYYARLRKYATL